VQRGGNLIWAWAEGALATVGALSIVVVGAFFVAALWASRGWKQRRKEHDRQHPGRPPEH
jgi:hypothetical protein